MKQLQQRALLLAAWASVLRFAVEAQHPRQPKAFVQELAQVAQYKLQQEVVAAADTHAADDVETVTDSSAASRLVHDLRKELGATEKDKKKLRTRLNKVSGEAHRVLGELREQVEAAEAAAADTESKLQTQVNEESTKLAAAEKRDQLLAADAEEAGKLKYQVELARTDAAKTEKHFALERKLAEHLQASARTAAAAAQKQLATEKGNVQQLQTASRKAAASAEAHLLEAKHMVERLQASSHAAASAAEERFAVQKHKVEQLQSQLNTTEAAAAAVAKEASEKRKEDLAKISELESQVQESQSNATSAAKDVASLTQAVSKTDRQLRAAFVETGDLRAARDAASRGEVAFQQMDAKAETTLKQQSEKLAVQQQASQQEKVRLDVALQQLAALTQEKNSLQAQFTTLKTDTAKAAAEDEKSLHSTMLLATQKVHEAEDARDTLASDLNRTKAELISVSAESAKAKDTLVQETDAALVATQQAEGLTGSLKEAQDAAAKNGKRVAFLTTQVEALTSDRDRTVATLAESSSAATKWHDEASRLRQAFNHATVSDKQDEAENEKLHDQIADLSGEGQRVDALSQQLEGARKESRQNAAKVAALTEQMERLRDLKDRYSNDYEAVRNESDTWRARSAELSSQLQTTEKKSEKLATEKTESLERVHMLRSQEDEYFQENSRLQQQDEVLTAQLNTAESSANQSADEERVLSEEVRGLKASADKQEAVSHAAWVATENELMQAKQDVKLAKMLKDSTQAELTRTQRALTDAQRKTLGLDPAESAKKVAQASAASVTNTAPTVSAGVARLRSQPYAQGQGPMKTPAPKATASQLQVVAKHAATAQVPAPLLPGEPRAPADDAMATLEKAEAVSTPATPQAEAFSTPATPQNALQKLAAYFASPVGR